MLAQFATRRAGDALARQMDVLMAVLEGVLEQVGQLARARTFAFSRTTCIVSSGQHASSRPNC